MLVCAECDKPIDAGRAVVERVDDPWDDDRRPELGWFCETCAERLPRPVPGSRLKVACMLRSSRSVGASPGQRFSTCSG
jgi:hypothetical protein